MCKGTRFFKMKQILTLKENSNINKIQNPADLFNKIKKINIDYSQENFLYFV